MQIILALVIGALFGFVLDRIGATNPTVLIRMLSLRALGLMKAILLAIGVGSILMFGGQMVGLIDVGHMSVKTVYLGVFVGGLLLGAGWAMSGFCPGTGVCAAATGRKDALFFILGGLLGAAAYMITYPSVKATGLLDAIAGGKVTLGTVPAAKYDGLTALPGDVLGIALGLLFIVIAFVLPEAPQGQEAEVQPAE
ncbi:YeeE/YedE family protein [Aliiroseovarius crassostreae]|uniref:YeeE/YedE family protein n=1 Tax=Aliiroseovarius crassostreae TaxID=154981 RepID=A0A9Q9LU57_9RHOB|nr:YeeE/YedE family protein [Aliiroseovarius crassostreae]UWP94456.1 YeeE/YedE family protein [Aliiroseovarius crassostreae]